MRYLVRPDDKGTIVVFGDDAHEVSYARAGSNGWRFATAEESDALAQGLITDIQDGVASHKAQLARGV